MGILTRSEPSPLPQKLKCIVHRLLDKKTFEQNLNIDDLASGSLIWI